jgi:hypothetical protein
MWGLLISIVTLVIAMCSLVATGERVPRRPRPMPYETETTKIWKGVREVRVYACSDADPADLPPGLRPDVLAQMAASDIGNQGVTFADGQSHNPLIFSDKKCSYEFGRDIEIPGTLSFITTISPVYGRGSENALRFILVSKYIYRSDFYLDANAIIRYRPNIIDLSDTPDRIRTQLTGWRVINTRVRKDIRLAH